MPAKLTLSLETDVIARAKMFSRRQHKSLSKLVEGYLRDITGQSGGTAEITPKVVALSGVISPESADKGHKARYADYLSEKYR